VDERRDGVAVLIGGRINCPFALIVFWQYRACAWSLRPSFRLLVLLTYTLFL
jgi:hypothetical protein